MEKGSNPFEAKSKEVGQAKKIHKLCNGNYQMYVRRRKPDSLEVQQMKVNIFKWFLILYLVLDPSSLSMTTEKPPVKTKTANEMLQGKQKT